MCSFRLGLDASCWLTVEKEHWAGTPPPPPGPHCALRQVVSFGVSLHLQNGSGEGLSQTQLAVLVSWSHLQRTGRCHPDLVQE